jgi:hypothetical protein
MCLYIFINTLIKSGVLEKNSGNKNQIGRKIKDSQSRISNEAIKIFKDLEKVISFYLS